MRRDKCSLSFASSDLPNTSQLPCDNQQILFCLADRSFVVANAQPSSCHIIFCSDGFCKMTGFTRAEVMQRSASTDFLHGQLTSSSVVVSIREALRDGEFFFLVNGF